MVTKQNNEIVTFSQVWQMFKETDKKFQETDRQMKETDRHLKETDRQMKETSKKIAETDLQIKETDKQLKKLSIQIGGLGNSIGNIVEGLAFPSIEKELIDKFKVEFVTANAKKRKANKNFELDALAYSNSSKNEVYIVEIKSNLSKDAIEQLKEIMNKFRIYYPEHKDKKLYGILCAVKAQEKEIKQIYENGFYFASVKDGMFKINQPRNFKPKEF